MAKEAEFEIALAGDVSLRDATGLAQQFQAALATHTAIVVNTEELTGMDITIAQLLLATRKSALAAGKSMTLRAPASGALGDFLVKAGFVEEGRSALTPEADFWTRTNTGQAA